MQRRYKIQMKEGKGPGIICLFLQGQERKNLLAKKSRTKIFVHQIFYILITVFRLPNIYYELFTCPTQIQLFIVYQNPVF